jgi:hypothetical protein
MLHPRVLDYTMWSLFELLLLRRTALMLHLRSFMQEKVALFDQELKHHHYRPGTPSSGMRTSSPFSKPRRRHSGLLASESSPHLTPSHSLTAMLASHEGPRLAGYQRSPPSPTSPRVEDAHDGPKIVHLGPVDAEGGFFRAGAVSPVASARAARIKSEVLVDVTYRRIRLVQGRLGYVPIGGGEGEGEGEQQETMCTMKAVLEMIAKEMCELSEEFADQRTDDAKANESSLGPEADQSVLV